MRIQTDTESKETRLPRVRMHFSMHSVVMNRWLGDPDRSLCRLVVFLQQPRCSCHPVDTLAFGHYGPSNHNHPIVVVVIK